MGRCQLIYCQFYIRLLFLNSYIWLNSTILSIFRPNQNHWKHAALWQNWHDSNNISLRANEYLWVNKYLRVYSFCHEAESFFFCVLAYANYFNWKLSTQYKIAVNNSEEKNPRTVEIWWIEALFWYFFVLRRDMMHWWKSKSEQFRHCSSTENQ